MQKRLWRTEIDLCKVSNDYEVWLTLSVLLVTLLGEREEESASRACVSETVLV